MYHAKPKPCLLCGFDYNRLYQDHCHATGLIRDFVCRQCNFDIAALENPDIQAFRAKFGHMFAPVRQRALEDYVARWAERHRDTPTAKAYYDVCGCGRRKPHYFPRCFECHSVHQRQQLRENYTKSMQPRLRKLSALSGAPGSLRLAKKPSKGSA